MNVTALVSSFSSARIAGNSPARTAGNGAFKAVSFVPPEVPSASTVVTLSAEGCQAAAGSVYPAGGSVLGELLWPTRENVAKLARDAEKMINAKLDAAGISRTPAFDLVIEDVNSAHVTVKGNRPDAKLIENLINDDLKLQSAVHNTYALASYIPMLEAAAAFLQTYAASLPQAEIDKALARLLNDPLTPTDIELGFGKAGLTVTINGETVNA
jgi:hypothetical protein